MILLGDKAKHTITGFTGIVIGRAEYLHGCVRCLVQPQGIHEGKMIESEWLDEGGLEVVEEQHHKVSEDEESPGGPQFDAPKR